VIDQGALGVDAGIALPASRLVIFGNPPLGLLFLTAEPDSGMDWSVRASRGWPSRWGRMQRA